MPFAFLPVIEFDFDTTTKEGKALATLLHARVVHTCLDLIFEPLKKTARESIMLQDPEGFWHSCYTPLFAYIGDIKEMWRIIGLQNFTSLTTLASGKQLGDPTRHETRHGTWVLQALDNIKAHPWEDIYGYMRAANQQHLIGVDLPFWRDWMHADPAYFTTQEYLHYYHKGFYDHDFRWTVKALTPEVFNRRIGLFQPIMSKMSFKGNVSNAKQVTGKAYKNLQRFIVPMLDGLPRPFQNVVRSLCTVRLLANLDTPTDLSLVLVNTNITEFHVNKEILLQKKTSSRGRGYAIPKLELMLSIEFATRAMGNIPQYSAQATEYLHRPIVKNPYRIHTNKRQDYLHQICRHLDRWEKRRLFAEQMEMEKHRQSDKDGGTKKHWVGGSADNASEGSEVDEEDEPDIEWNHEEEPEMSPWLTMLLTGEGATPSRTPTNYFKQLEKPKKGRHTFANLDGSVAFHLNNKSKRMTVDEASDMWSLADFRPALSDYFGPINVLPRKSSQSQSKAIGDPVIGGDRQSGPNALLRFDKILVWNNVRVQKHSVQLHRRILPSIQLQGWPPKKDWPYGRSDTCIVSNDPSAEFHGFISLMNDGKIILHFPL
jgi:hypothetical protein